jgi:putative membrane protein
MLLERHGESAVGIGAVSLFQGFLANWLAGLTSPLEAYFERLGRNSEVSVSLLGFRHVDDLRGIFVVPKIHPGPFKNLGSSNLPWLIQKTLEEKTSATVMVPHGTSGHETDLASQRYVEKVLQAIVELARFDCFSDEATPMARAELGNTKATCQIFGGVALVTLTCAPESMEDIPPEVGEEIVARGKALGAKEVIVIDAHNSIGSHRELHMLSNEQLKALRDVAVAAIANALSQRKGRLKFGAARVVPQEWGAKEGLGSGGISVAAICVDNQMVAYVVIDGNNLVSGLREEIIESLKGLVDVAVVLTTDTQAVNALSTVERGYHPIGEAMDRSLLISYVRDCTIMAIKAASISSTAFRYGIIPNVQVIGEDTLRGLSMLVSSSLRLLRLLMCLIYIPALVASALLLIP